MGYVLRNWSTWAGIKWTSMRMHGTALACLGWAIAQTDDVSGGIRGLEEGLAMYNRLGLRTNLCIMICLLAETYFMAGEYQRGIQQVNLAIETSAEIGD